MTDKELDELIAENEKLEWTCRQFRKLWLETKEENMKLRKLLLDRGVKHE